MKKGERTKESILQSAVKIASKDGYLSMTREAVARDAGCAESLINVHFSTMTQLRSDVMRWAIKNNELRIIAQGIMHGDKRAKRLSDEVKKAALISMG